MLLQKNCLDNDLDRVSVPVMAFVIQSWAWGNTQYEWRHTGSFGRKGGHL